MIGFNRFKNKLKNSNGINSPSPNKKECSPILQSSTNSSPLLSPSHQQYTTLTRKSMLRSRKIAIFGNKGDFLSNLLVTVLSQYECLVTLVFLQQPKTTNEDNGNTNNNQQQQQQQHPPSITISEISFEETDKIDEIIKENDVIIACFEWCEFRAIYNQVRLISNSCKNINNSNNTDNINNNCNNTNDNGGDIATTTNGNGNNNNSVIFKKQIMVVFPIGVEDIEYSLENISIESIFDPLQVTFIFYSSLMQWLFIGPPSISQPHLQLVLSKSTEGCYWLDCDDLIKAIVELVIQIDLSGSSKMYVLTGKECLTCGEISNILYNECSIIVDDYVEDITFLKDTTVIAADSNILQQQQQQQQMSPAKLLQKKFFTYLQSPISTVGSPSTEEIIKTPPNSFSSFISKCKETQLFTIKPSRSNSNGNDNGNGNKLGKSLPINLSQSHTPPTNTTTTTASMSSSLPSLSSSVDTTTTSTTNTIPVTIVTSPTKSSTPISKSPVQTPSPPPPQLQQPQPTTSSSSSSSYRFVFNPFNIIKYSKDFIEETLYRSPSPTINQSKKTAQELETQQYTSLLTSGFKKSFENELNNASNDTPTTTSPTPSTTSPTTTNNLSSSSSSSQSAPSSPLPPSSHPEFNNEDYLFESTIEILVDPLVNEDDTTTTTTTTIPSVPIQPVIQTQQQEIQSTTTTITASSATTTTTTTTTLTSSTSSTSSSTTNDNYWTFTTFSPKIFKEIRKYYGVDQDFLKNEENSCGIVKFIEVQTIGRSGSFFYKSDDSKYFIKTIPVAEYETFLKLFPSYYNHTMSYPNTLLPRFYGMYRLKGKLKLGNTSSSSYYSSVNRDIIFVVMANLFYSKQKLEIREKYDLKGSTIGRFVDINLIQQQQQQQHEESVDNSGSSGLESTTPIVDIQDLTFKDLNLKRKIHLGPLRKAFITQLTIDSEWMNSHGICDYSLLVGLHISDKKSIQFLKNNNLKGNGGKKEDISFFKKDCNGVASSVSTRKIQTTFSINRSRSLSCSSTSDNDLSTTTGAQPSQQPSQPTPDVVKQSLTTSNTNNCIGNGLNTDEEEEGIIYFLGLIDILTTYNLKKRGENAVKGLLFDRTQISAINPKDYQIRFIKYIESIFD